MPVRRGAGGRRVLAYHEKQTLLMQHCAVHTLNNVLQGPYYTAKHFEELANSLQHGRIFVDLSERQKPAVLACNRAEQPARNSSAGNTPARGSRVETCCAVAKTEECFAKCTTGGLPEGITRGCVTAEKGCASAETCQTHPWKVEVAAASKCVSGIAAPSSSATLRVPAHEDGISWRTRISSVLLGTDYSSPMGIGNYDLSLVQQLLCFHRLSLNFANNPSRAKASKHHEQECRVFSGENPNEGGVPTEEVTEQLTCSERQQRPAPREEQRVLHAPRHEQQVEYQSQHDTQSLKVFPRKRKQERDEAFRGCVTIEQLRNPRLLAFILNVKIPRRGWRRLLSVLRADRHFYTIRKVSCEAAARAEIYLRGTSKHFISATLPEVTDVFTARKESSAEVRTDYDELPEQSEENKDDIESGNRYRLRPQNLGEEDICAGQLICDNLRGTKMTECRHWKGENFLSVQPLASASHGSTCGIPQGKCGVDFVWLDLDSNLSKPRVFKNENALLTYLNNMLREAFADRGRSSTEQRRNIKEPLQAKGQGSATISSRTVASDGTNSEARPCNILGIGSVSGAQPGPKDTAVSRRSIVGSSACGQERERDSCVCNISGESRGRVIGCLGPEEGYHRTHGEQHVDVTKRRQYPNNGSPESVACAPRGSDLTFGLVGSSRPSGHTGRNRPVKFERAQGRREKMSMPKTSRENDEAADKVNGPAYTVRESSQDESVTSEMFCDEASETEQEDDHRSYKDLILIEVLEDDGRRG